MQGYGQFCPLAQAAQLLCERWTLLVIRELLAGSTHFSQLQKGVPRMSPGLLSERLHRLAAAGVISISGQARNTSYTLTAAGFELRPIVEWMGAWGQRWVGSDLREQDLDAGLLMWDMRRTVNVAVFPQRRIVVQFHYPDAPQGMREWWLVVADGIVDLCLSEPPYEVDIVLRCTLATMTAVWICRIEFNEAVRQGKITVQGNTQLAKNLQEWLGSSPLAALAASGTR